MGLGLRKKKRGPKVKAKQPLHRKKKVLKSIKSADIKKNYDNSKSPSENLKGLGLIANSNTMDVEKILANDDNLDR